ncbi:hypothetical protein HDV05_003484 [Chytridiales sp. JEL 0842]|nr:hypothetical protein HDV05_003484 [Chytridiales sp. JEL 0842]
MQQMKKKKVMSPADRDDKNMLVEDTDAQQRSKKIKLDTTSDDQVIGDHASTVLDKAISSMESNTWDVSKADLEGFGLVTECTINRPEPTNLALKVSSLGSETATHIKSRLLEPFRTLNKQLKTGNKSTTPNAFAESMTPLQQTFFNHIDTYKDLYYTNQTHELSTELRHTYCLHAMNHIYKGRDRVLKNNAKVKADEGVSDADGADLKDQGFTRPKVLILLPFKHTALEVVKMLITLSGASQCDNKMRFMEEFGIDELEDRLDTRKPADHLIDFAGNIDDCFRIGIKFSRKQMKLYSEFYSADVIVASPLGLRMIIGAEGDKKRDFDYLSSIEMVILDHTDVFLMQNWDHVQHIFDHLNTMPKSAHDCDFSRTKSWYLDGRIEASSVKDLDDARFKYFTEKTIPNVLRSAVHLKHTLIVIPSYFDFVRIRNYMKDKELSFSELCEYTSTADISRARGDMFNGRISFLLFTERFHFFRRYRIRGVKQVIFYALPEHENYYPEILNFVEGDAAEGGCTLLYSKYDKMKLERIVGSKRVGKMMEKDTFLFA